MCLFLSVPDSSHLLHFRCSWVLKRLDSLGVISVSGPPDQRRAFSHSRAGYIWAGPSSVSRFWCCLEGIASPAFRLLAVGHDNQLRSAQNFFPFCFSQGTYPTCPISCAFTRRRNYQKKTGPDRLESESANAASRFSRKWESPIRL